MHFAEYVQPLGIWTSGQSYVCIFVAAFNQKALSILVSVMHLSHAFTHSVLLARACAVGGVEADSREGGRN